MKYGKTLLILAACLVFCFGCGKGKPEGVPDLYPVSITVTKGATPVSEANVFLVPTSAEGSWSVNGITDANGVAIIKTSQGDWKQSGAPEGEFSIYITKLAKIDEPEKPADIETNEKAKQEYFAERLKRLEAANKEIPKVLTSATTSGLKITVASGSETKETFDISQYE
ncbi:MAG: flagellar biosynthetic protein FliO [Planctomycetia bacterium]|nr:flagellar biosynthetic protein FliO [Planctomycetia bacterium]